MMKASYDDVFLSTYSTFMLGSIQKFKRAWRTQNLLLPFIVLTSEKILNVFPRKHKTTKWETKLFLLKNKTSNDSIINAKPDRSYQALEVHLSLKQNLYFFMRKNEANLMREEIRPILHLTVFKLISLIL